MKKLFFIPAVLFVLLGLFLSVNANNLAPQTGVTIYFKDKAGNSITSSVTGCLGSYNFGSSTGSANLGNVTPGTYNACASGSGYLGTDTYVISGFTPMHITLTMDESAAACSMCNED